MTEKCKDCGKCCLDIEMILSKKDITLILQSYSQDLRKEDFVCESIGFFQLRNINGHCIFFDLSTKMCKIYPNRPQGCRFYPLIYNKDKKICVFDKDCPRTHLFYQSDDEFEKICKQIKMFVKEDLNLDL